MFGEFWKELLLAAVLTAVFFRALDLLGDFFVPETGEVVLSAGLMVFSIVVLVLPALAGCIPSGYLIAKKTKDIKAAVFVPAMGAGIGGLLIMAFAVAEFMLIPDSALQAQMSELADYGVDFFANMSLAEYKSMVMFSVAISAVFIALISFAIGLAGGFVGSKLAKKKISRPQPAETMK